MRKLTWAAAVLMAVAVPGVRVWEGMPPAAAAQDHVVTVDDKDRDQLEWKFVPQELDIAVGDSVTWDLTDAQISHSATADDKSFDSGLIPPGSTWTHTFDTPGEYMYHCEPHPWKKGVIRVT